MVELIFLTVLAGACLYIYKDVQANARSKEKLEVSENEAKILKAQRDSNVTNVDDALSVLKQVRKRRK